MSSQHAYITRRTNTGWHEQRIVLAHVEVALGPDDVFRTVNGNSEKLPIECAAAAQAYSSVLSVEIRDGDAHLVIPTIGRGARRLAGEWSSPPLFDQLYQVDGLSAEVAQATANFHHAMHRVGIWPYGDQMPTVRLVFPEAFNAAVNEIESLRAAHTAEVNELKRVHAERIAALETAYADRPPVLPASPPEPAAPAPASPSKVVSSAPSDGHSPLYASRAALLETLDAPALREIIRNHGISGSASKAEMRANILAHEFPDEQE